MKSIQSLFKKLYTLSLRFIQTVSLALTGVLFLCSFLFTCYSENMETQQVLKRWDNPLFNILGLLLLSLICFVVCRVAAGKLSEVSLNRLLLLFVSGLCLLSGAALILFSKTVPAADALSVYSAGEAFASGDLSAIHPTASYLSYYPQQIGLTAFYELLIRFWNLFSTGLPAYHFIKCVYVLLALVILLLGYQCVLLLWKDLLAGRLYLLLMGANLPFLMYTSFVYGEIPSFAAVSLGFYCFLRLLCTQSRQGSALWGILSAAAMALGVALRKNSLILVIALLIVELFQSLKTKRRLLFLFTLLTAVLSLSSLPLIQKAYELRSGSTLSSGVPAISYLAMGMQEASRGNGWYNGFNFHTYQEAGMDAQAAAAVSRQAISERLRYFKEHPGYAAGFYLDKELSQWADGTYACRQATLATYGGRLALFESLYTGDLSCLLISYCNAYQNLLYLGAFLFCLFSLSAKQTSGRTKKETGGFLSGLPVYLGMIGILGGFLFHTAWEANSRYIFLYSLLLVPYGARGLSQLFAIFPNLRSSKAPVSPEL